MINSSPDEAENYELKLEHTYRVVGNIKMLSELSNFDESYGILRDRKYIEKMFKTLPYDERLTSAKEDCLEYIENRLQK